MEYFVKVLFLSACVLFVKGEVLTHGDGSVHAGFNVSCSDTAITVMFNKTALDERNRNDDSNNRNYTIAWKGQKSDYNCIISADNTSAIMGNMISITANYPSQCGLTEKYTNDIIYYNQTIVVTYGSNPNNFIRREEYDYYAVACTRNRTIEQSFNDYNVSFRTPGSAVKNNTKDYNFIFSHSDTNDSPKDKYELGDYIKFKVQFNTVGTSTKAIVQKCWSTSDGSSNAYNLINSRCIDDSGSRSLTSTDKLTSWETEAFRYLSDSNSAIYVECLVRVCLDTDSTAECTFCPSKRKRRDVNSAESSGEMALIKSPIFYIVEKDQTTTPQSNESSSSALSGTNGTIIIVLLATLVFIIAVVVIKKVFFPTIVAVPTGAVKGIDNKGLA